MVDQVSWRVSATYVGAFVQSARKFGYFDALASHVDPAARAMLDGPALEAWWPGQRLLTCLSTLADQHGAPAVREVSIDLSRERMGPLVRPLVSVLLMFTRSPLISLFSRTQTLISSGVHGVDARFTPANSTSGRLEFLLPEPVPAVMAEVWSGVFDVGFTLAGGGRIVSQDIKPRVHRYDLQG